MKQLSILSFLIALWFSNISSAKNYKFANGHWLPDGYEASFIVLGSDPIANFEGPKIFNCALSKEILFYSKIFL
jgi:hypothetical protein